MTPDVGPSAQHPSPPELEAAPRTSGPPGTSPDGGDNQAALMATVQRLRGSLTGTDVDSADLPAATGAAELDAIAVGFGLSPFERDVLVLAAAPELDASFASTLAAAHGVPYPTFGLALAALPGAHWSALAPDAPLRRWRLVDLDGSSPSASPLRVDERVLHALTGTDELAGATSLNGLLAAAEPPSALPPSQAAIAQRLAARWAAGSDANGTIIDLIGRVGVDKHLIAAAAAAAVGARLGVVAARRLPTEAADLDRLARLLEREAVLASSAVLVDADGATPDEALDVALCLVEQLAAPAALATRERITGAHRPVLSLDVAHPTVAEQRTLWQAFTGSTGTVDEIVGQFDLDIATISAIAASPEARHDGLWSACRAHTRPRFGGLVQRVESSATWDDLVVPRPQRELLRHIGAHARHRYTVFEQWGLRNGGDSTRGRGTAVLFCGPSGTGKTLAAEILAAELSLDLYRIDLAGVVSKYIGETEKNLRGVFDAAADGGSILLFDEADALFGKRSEVKDSHDRYANTEIAYLLQRMEDHPGISILTTNMRDAIDTAFVRRLRFVVEFPFPDAVQRAEMWRRAFPSPAPTAGLDTEQLSRLDLSGGSIRNVSVLAAFLAAADGGTIEMPHVFHAARIELAKLDRPVHVVRGVS